jgi:formyltetrahydrofolate deformylase
VIAAIAGFIHQELGGNILDLHHHTEEEDRLFFLIARFSLPEANVRRVASLADQPVFRALEEAFGWSYAVYDLTVKPRVAILVSKTDHCLYELILKTKEGYLNADLCCVLSNHDDLAPVAERFGLPFRYFPMREKAEQEARIEETMTEYRVDTVVLARYMQILSSDFIRRWEGRIINVHHGFLPAFKGARPYHQAWKRGVKIIGATAHYATEDLDEGPILYQDVTPVRNNLSVKEFVQRGKDIERKVIVEGLKLHLERRVFLREGRTIIL